MKRKRGKIEWNKAPDVTRRIKNLAKKLNIDWIHTSRIFCFRSFNANTRAFARIWGLGRIWQQALGLTPAYVIEVISEKYDRLSQVEQDKVLLHELTHIPKNFSGALMPHVRRGKGRFEDRVHELIYRYLRKR